jgi:hypothetical protein
MMALPIKMTAKFTIFLFSSLLVLGLVAGWFGYRKFSKPSHEVVATVGPYQITDEAVLYQMQINYFVIPQKTDRAFALNQLKEMYTDQLIMERYGWHIRPEDLAAERERIEKNTHARRQLQRIQEIPGFDPLLYNEIFVRRTLIQRTIFNDFYFSNVELHEPTRRQALEFASRMKGQSLAKIKAQALGENLRVFNLQIDSTNGFKIQHLLKPQGSPSSSGASDPSPPEMTNDQKKTVAHQWLQSHLTFQKIHDAYLFDEHEQWALLFPEEWKPQLQIVRGVFVVIPKEPFQNWIQKEKQKALALPESGAN